MIHIYTGTGKGKTTASFGLAFRASGQGLRVGIFQFLKSKKVLSGEQAAVKKLKKIKLVVLNETHPIFNPMSLDTLKKKVGKDFSKVKKAVFSKKYDLVILDEVVNLVDQDFLSKKEFLKFLKKIPKKMELVLTGRGDISDIEKYADYVTVMIDKKHPFHKRKPARRGIEY